nr:MULTISPECIES: transposase [Methylomicrobium]
MNIKDGFAVLPERWGVERTFAWLGQFRLFAKDFEVLAATAESGVRIAMITLILAKCL